MSPQMLWTLSGSKQSPVGQNSAPLSPSHLHTAWPLTQPLEDNLQQSHYVALIIFFFSSSDLTLCRVAGLGRRVRGREEEGKDAGQTRATAASWEDWPAWSRFEPPTLQLSVTRWPKLGVRTTHQPELMDLAADAAEPPTANYFHRETSDRTAFIGSLLGHLLSQGSKKIVLNYRKPTKWAT